jgi:hypothetical protein
MPERQSEWQAPEKSDRIPAVSCPETDDGDQPLIPAVAMADTRRLVVSENTCSDPMRCLAGTPSACTTTSGLQPAAGLTAGIAKPGLAGLRALSIGGNASTTSLIRRQLNGLLTLRLEDPFPEPIVDVGIPPKAQ